MKEALRIAVFVSIVLIGLFILSILSADIRDRYIHKFIIGRVETYVEKNFGAQMDIGEISGNIINGLKLENISISSIDGGFKGYLFRAESIVITYDPFSLLLRRHFNADFIKPTIKINRDIVPIDIIHRGHITKLVLRKKKLSLDNFKSALPPECGLNGPMEIHGAVILRDFKTESINIKLKCPDLSVYWRPYFSSRGSLDILIGGMGSVPEIKGDIVVKQFNITGDLAGIPFDEFKKGGLLGVILNRSLMDIDVIGDNIYVKNDKFKGYASLSLNIEKPRDGDISTPGRIDIKKGEYTVNNNMFRVKSGFVEFQREGGDPIIYMEAETKVKRYKIYAKISGTFDEAHLTLSSKPELGQAEIASLIIFKKSFDNLTGEEKNSMSGNQVRSMLINNIIFGKAKAVLAETLGVDDVDIAFNKSDKEHGGINSASVSVDKYMAGDKLYGTYKIEPKENSGVLSGPAQSFGTALALNDNITLKGERNWHKSLMLPDEDKVDIEFRWKF